MSEFALLLCAVLVVAAYALGGWSVERMNRRMWTTDGYCPTCDRLTTEQEADR